MPGSLKAYAPLLASRLGTTPAALYERQRALVREGILEQTEGRGPGSGVLLGPYQVALLLLAVLVTDSLTETGERVRSLGSAKSTSENGICPFTGKPTFAAAVARVLDPTGDVWKGIQDITVRRTEGIGVISYNLAWRTTEGIGVINSQNESLRSGDSIFVGETSKPWAPTKLRIDAVLSRDLIVAIAVDLRKAAEELQRSRAEALERPADVRRQLRTDRGRRRRKHPRLKRGKKL